MSDFTFAVEGGHSVRLKTAGTYCPQDIVVTAKGSADSFYDQFWDAYQQDGNIQNCDFLFAGDGWNNTTYKPKYTLTPTNSYAMYQHSNIKDGSDLKVDFSNSTNMYMCFQGSLVEILPEIEATGSNVDMYYCFNGCYYLKRIEKLVLGGAVKRYDSMFAGCAELGHMIVEGVINKAGFNISHCKKLDRESLLSILTALCDFGQTSTNMTVTLGTDNIAKLTDTEKAIATEKGWTLV